MYYCGNYKYTYCTMVSMYHVDKMQGIADKNISAKMFAKNAMAKCELTKHN